MKRKISLLPIVVILAVLALLNFYVFGGFAVLFPSNKFAVLFGGLVIAIIISFIVALFRFGNRNQDVFFKIAVHAFVGFTVSEILFSIILLIGDITRMVLNIAGFHLTERIYGFSLAAAIAFVLMILLFAYGMISGKYRYRVIKQVLYFEDLPNAFDGFTVTQISDIHSGSFGNADAVQRGIDLIKAQNSDLFVFTGDLVNNKSSEIVPWIPMFSQIKAQYGTFSILGNHDYGDYVQWPSEDKKRENLDDLKRQHQKIGFSLLLDEHVEIEKDGEKIILAGVENWGLGFGERGDLNQALVGTKTDEFKVLLSHDPSHFDAQVKNHPSKIHLTLSGHTHGMQFGIEAFGIKWSPVSLRYKHWAGLKEEFGRYLYVNRGFGFLGFSGRVGIWPEITVIELRKK
ncbi:MAG: metallophosphoesterase [Bacteroidetes bacterium]|nr:metallophosphoesterase [Bacteroidota bacterium]MBU1373906.1 metallophosphoesterase [Bacteroidota bacterium]MBU1485511.1 metallophosphoesterase [Bacteroidota bacterium]MBU1760729.1 metallophosphoesterase [Bacteroidota bacterium]MBU2045699.1 metallophosphoesterase [Bacteroidota bacterium]